MYWNNAKRNRWIIIFQILILMIMDANAQIKKDHELHYLGGFIIGGTAYTYAYSKTGDKKLAFWSGLCSSFMAGVSKELIDAKYFDGYVDHDDILATTLGGLTISLTIPLFEKKKHYKKLDLNLGGYEKNNNNAVYFVPGVQYNSTRKQ